MIIYKLSTAHRDLGNLISYHPSKRSAEKAFIEAQKDGPARGL